MDIKKQYENQLVALKGHIARYIFSVVKNEDDTNDIVQEVLLKAYTRINTLKDEEKLKQWVFSIARNEMNAFFNAKKKEQPTLDDISIEENHLNEQFENCVDSFVKDLPQKYSDAVRLADLESVSQKELAQKLNISYSGAKSRVQRGREKLK